MKTKTPQKAVQKDAQKAHAMAQVLFGRLCVLTHEAQREPASNEGRTRMAHSAKAVLDYLLEDSGAVTLDFVVDCVFFEGGRLKTDTIAKPALDYFIGQMKIAKVRAINFDASIGAEDIMSFCQALTRVDASSRSPFEEIKRQMKFDGIAGISLVERRPGLDEFYQKNALLLSDSEQANLAFFSALRVVEGVMQDGLCGRVTPRDTKRAVESLVDRIHANRDSILALTHTRSFDDHLPIHSVNVCIFSLAIASKVGFPKRTLQEIGIAALFHDIGKTLVPSRILRKTENITDYDRQQIAKHTTYGIQMLAHIDQPDREILAAMASAFCHHMSAYGSGYPPTARGIRPNIVSRIIRIADVYDSLTNAGARIRPFARNRALAIIQEKAGAELDPLLCRIFIDLVLAMPGRMNPPKFDSPPAA